MPEARACYNVKLISGTNQKTFLHSVIIVLAKFAKSIICSLEYILSVKYNTLLILSNYIIMNA